MKKIILLLIVVVIVMILVAGLEKSERRKNRINDTNDQVSESMEVKSLENTYDLSTMTRNTYLYGNHELEALDVYTTPNHQNAPILVMVHGGGWQIGDKSNEKVVRNKLDYWLPLGYVFVSINYPMIPQGNPVDGQAQAIAEALKYIQINASDWGADASRMIVAGHSAGAHLVSLVAAKRASYADLLPWSGTILLDSAAYDLVAKMEDRHEDLYDEAFGTDINYWRANSPLAQLTSAPSPTFIVCSSKRKAEVCETAEEYKSHILSLGGEVSLIRVPLSHEEINSTLGLPGDYTDSVDDFMSSLVE